MRISKTGEGAKHMRRATAHAIPPPRFDERDHELDQCTHTTAQRSILPLATQKLNESIKSKYLVQVINVADHWYVKYCNGFGRP
jgi:hypothetical protein